MIQQVDRLRELARDMKVKAYQERAREILARYGYGPLRCDCCGYTPLQRARLLNGRLVGPECAKPGHQYPCKGRGA